MLRKVLLWACSSLNCLSSGERNRLRIGSTMLREIHVRATSGFHFAALAVLVACAGAGCTGMIGEGPVGGGTGDGDRGGTPAPAGGKIAGGGPGGVTPSGSAGVSVPIPPESPGSMGQPSLPAPPGGGGATPGIACGGGIKTGPAPLRRLTRDEYDHSVRDLLADTSSPARAFLADEKVGPFDGNAVAPVTDAIVEKYLAAAESVAAAVVARLSSVVPCAAASDEACGNQFVADFGRRAFRRPLGAVELARYRALFVTGRTGTTFADGIRLVITAMLASPHFLYHVDIGDVVAGVPALAKLSPHEIAARLSYFLQGTTPDGTLGKAADGGALASVDGIDREVRRLLATASSADALARFHIQWMGVDRLADVVKDAKLFPSWTDDVKAALLAETGRFGSWVIQEGGAKVETLLTSPVSFQSASLYKLYGVKDPGGSAAADGSKKVLLDPKQRSGILTQAGTLAATAAANQSNPILRGKFVRQALLCQELPPPPPNVNTSPPAVDPKVTTRERFRQHRNDPSCNGCHTLLDPVGLGFESYDAIGRFRTMDGINPVDATGEIIASPPDLIGSFQGPLELAGRLAASATFKHCLATQWMQFGLGRALAADDQCSAQQAVQALTASGNDLRELIVALTKTDAFRYREVTP